MSEDRDRLRERMMAALDGELDDTERAELDRRLSRDPELREEWEQMTRVKEATVRFSLRIPPEEVWDGYWQSVYNRLERGIGWLLVSVGAAVVLGWVAWSVVDALLQDQTVPGLLKLAIFAVLLGGILLAISVVREKWFTGRRDPYRGVRR